LERGSDKHSPRIDEELDHETRSLQQGAPIESRVEEFREQEGPGEDQPTPEPHLTEATASLDLDDAEARWCWNGSRPSPPAAPTRACPTSGPPLAARSSTGSDRAGTLRRPRGCGQPLPVVGRRR
jgi:hypothetical protein